MGSKQQLNNFNKRGVSTVVATVLLLLITISVFVTISQFLIPFVRDQLDKAGECKNVDYFFDFEQSIGDNSYNCISKEGNNNLIIFSLRGAPEIKSNYESINGFLIELINDEQRSALNVTRGQLPNKNLGGVWELGSLGTLEIPNSNDVITYVYNTSNVNYDYLRVHSLLKSGRICASYNQVKLNNCLLGGI